MPKCFLALISAPKKNALDLARLLVNEAVASCVQVSQAVTSVYYWQGKLCEEEEVLLWVKTTRAKLKSLKELVCKHHPYQVPELIFVPIKGGHEAYLEWLIGSVNRNPASPPV